jgi:hypothetical protein
VTPRLSSDLIVTESEFSGGIARVSRTKVWRLGSRYPSVRRRTPSAAATRNSKLGFRRFRTFPIISDGEFPINFGFGPQPMRYAIALGTAFFLPDRKGSLPNNSLVSPLCGHYTSNMQTGATARSIIRANGPFSIPDITPGHRRDGNSDIIKVFGPQSACSLAIFSVAICRLSKSSDQKNARIGDGWNSAGGVPNAPGSASAMAPLYCTQRFVDLAAQPRVSLLASGDRHGFIMHGFERHRRVPSNSITPPEV